MKPKKIYFIVFSLIMIGVTAVFVHYLYLPKWQETVHNQAGLKQKEAMLEKAREQSDNFGQLKEDTMALSTKAANLEKNFPQALDKQEIALLLYHQTRKYGLSLKELSFDSPKNEGSVLTLVLNLRCEGTENGILTFLEKLNSDSAYKFTIDSTIMGFAENIVTVKVKMTAYAFTPQADRLPD
ncbi:hypothetical protein Sgly_1937 [Syntrophobotulus glycolicus DSM 8271]|uniref:Uncharacterized protein n=1 Tax=Syntrophobotulus glycolicus (strain DSM 8271 / FlGlyR) TaxID=645991 RepID=F0T0U4_SYNGF|nr:hypothetical protein [Syntrophobotulus glycolicus]ADY56233.1 hypothetical protein Sgly_1937 [Syntrophobotulus glycolicus DSM 8271]